MTQDYVSSYVCILLFSYQLLLDRYLLIPHVRNLNKTRKKEKDQPQKEKRGKDDGGATIHYYGAN